MSLRNKLLKAAALAAVVTASLGSPAMAQKKITYLMPAPVFLPAFAPWMLAKHLGYYKAEGYEVNFVRAKGGVDVVKQVGAGNAPIGGGLGDTSVIVRSNGIPVKAVASLGGGALMVVVARGDRGINSPKDLKGKTIAVLSYQDTTYYALLGVLATAGLTKKDVNIIAVGPRNTPGMVIAGKADACACVPDWEIFIKLALKGKIKSMPAKDYFPSMSQTLYVSDKTIKNDPKFVQGMVTATLKALKYIMDDPKKAAADYVKAVPRWKGKEKLIELIMRNYIERTYKGGKLGMIDAARLAKLQDFYLKQKITRKRVKVSDLYTNQFIK